MGSLISWLLRSPNAVDDRGPNYDDYDCDYDIRDRAMATGKGYGKFQDCGDDYDVFRDKGKSKGEGKDTTKAAEGNGKGTTKAATGNGKGN